MNRAIRAICLLASVGLILAAIVSAMPPEADGNAMSGGSALAQEDATPEVSEETEVAEATESPAVTLEASPAPKPKPESLRTTPPPPETDADAAKSDAPQARGQVTNMPLPRYVSLKGSTGNARRGPGLTHRIDWVFRHAGMPLRVTAEYGHWRRIEDRDGAGGWIHYALLSGVRTAIVEEDNTELKARPDAASGTIALAQAGAIVRLGKCTLDWCDVSAGSEDGWVHKDAIWGVDPEELRD